MAFTKSVKYSKENIDRADKWINEVTLSQEISHVTHVDNLDIPPECQHRQTFVIGHASRENICQFMKKCKGTCHWLLISFNRCESVTISKHQHIVDVTPANLCAKLIDQLKKYSVYIPGIRDVGISWEDFNLNPTMESRDFVFFENVDDIPQRVEANLINNAGTPMGNLQLELRQIEGLQFHRLIIPFIDDCSVRLKQALDYKVPGPGVEVHFPQNSQCITHVIEHWASKKGQWLNPMRPILEQIEEDEAGYIRFSKN
eukprot:TRINITY_DN4530_c1_g1_i7.p2 TRINITY_DN4530_c1_g1~~TRINITY_DN4530_c1_g1_i7.p2  ORF type:complete len:258 (+),score=69.70 TRINITY_DN4530_c1_g1_i7:1199-1972(+)